MKQPFLSIIVPVYNALSYLRDCLESIICQQFDDMEVILIDDGSDDGSHEVCQLYAKKYGNIKFLHQENRGALKARQTAVAAASGKYIGFVDADDWIEPGMYLRLCSAARLNNADLVVCDYVKHTADKAEVCGFRSKPGLYDANTYENNVLVHLFCSPNRSYFSPLCTQWNAIVSADNARQELEILPGDLFLGEDTAFIMGCALSSNRFVYINEALYHYRIHKDSIMQVDRCSHPGELSQQRALLYQYLKYRANKHSICRIFGQLESYMLFLAMFDLHTFFSFANKSLVEQYLSAPWLVDLLTRELDNPLPQHWRKAVSALTVKLQSNI